MRRPPSKDEDFYQWWGIEHCYCACCGSTNGLSTHHIVKQGRAHEACNLLRLCVHPCHDLAEGLDVPDPAGLAWKHSKTHGDITTRLLPKLTIGHCLFLKWINDPHEYDGLRLQELRGSRLPDPEPVDERFLNSLRRAAPWLSVRMIEAADLSIIPRPPEFRR